MFIVCIHIYTYIYIYDIVWPGPSGAGEEEVRRGHGIQESRAL